MWFTILKLFFLQNYEWMCLYENLFLTHSKVMSLRDKIWFMYVFKLMHGKRVKFSFWFEYRAKIAIRVNEKMIWVKNIKPVFCTFDSIKWFESKISLIQIIQPGAKSKNWISGMIWISLSCDSNHAHTLFESVNLVI